VGFWKTVVGLARRKHVGFPVVVAAILLALAGWFLVPSRYVSTASMVLTVPATGGTLETLPESKPGLTNPLLQFNDALRTTAGILILATNTPEVAAELGVTEDGPTSLTINDGRTNPDLLGISTNGPFIYIEVESTSPQVVRDVMAKAQQRVKLELAERQDELDAPISTHIGILDVMPPSLPKRVVQDRLMAAAGGGFAGVAGGLAVAYGITRSGLSARQRRSRAGEQAAEPAQETEPAPETEAVEETPAEKPEKEAPHRNGARLGATGLPSFPLTVEELESAEKEDVSGTQEIPLPGDGLPTENPLSTEDALSIEDTGPIEVTRNGQLDSTT